MTRQRASIDPMNDGELDFEASTSADDTAFAPGAWCSDPDERRAYLRLAWIQGLGPRRMAQLLGYFETPSAALAAPLSQLLQIDRLGPKLADSIRTARHDDWSDKVLAECHRTQTQVIMPGDATYPRLLSELSDPPLCLFVRGAFEPADQLSLAVVGSRHATTYGKQATETIVRGLARAGLTIVSGLARGIDAVAHRAALDVQGRTLAVLGSSLSEIYPPEHAELADEISRSGAILSETPPFLPPKPGVFPARNRLISGLSLGVLVVEAADRSGALITASHAGDQGRDLFAVPGPINARMSRGANRLIRDGAILVQDAQDIIDHLGPLVASAKLDGAREVRHPAELKLNEQEQQVLQAIGDTLTDIDEVVMRSGIAISRVLSTISVLELRGLVIRQGARNLQRR